MKTDPRKSVALSRWLSLITFPAIAVILWSPNSTRAQIEEEFQADEEIVVSGRRSFNALTREGATLTEGFYMRLNDVLAEPDFKITCRTEAATGTNLRARVCITNFQRRFRGREAASVLRNITPGPNGDLRLSNWNGNIDPVGAEALARATEFEGAMLEAINSDPVLNQQFVRLMELKAALENYRSARRGE